HALRLGFMLQLVNRPAKRAGEGFAGNGVGAGVGNGGKRLEITSRLADPLPQLYFLLLGGLNVVNLVVARSGFLTAEAAQLVVNLLQPAIRRLVVAPALVIVIAGRPQQSESEDAANHKKQVAFDPGHSYRFKFGAFVSVTATPNVKVLLDSSLVMLPNRAVPLGSQNGLAFNSLSTS